MLNEQHLFPALGRSVFYSILHRQMERSILPVTIITCGITHSQIALLFFFSLPFKSQKDIYNNNNRNK